MTDLGCNREITQLELNALQEIRQEITRVNQAAGETVFNPALTQLLEGILRNRGRKV